MTPRINLNEAFPIGVLAGFNAEGRVIVCLEWGATIDFFIGTENDRKDVLEWQMCKAQDRRVRWIRAWQDSGFPCSAVPQ